MTVSTTDNRVAYLGNGTTKDFPFRNRFLADVDIVVLQKDNTTGAVTTKTLTTDYTLAGATGAEGGPATVLVAPPTGTSLIIYRDPVMTQPIGLVNGVPLNVETGPETGFDRAMLQVQRVKDMYDRTIRLHDGNDTVLDTILAPAVADQVFAWSSDVASVSSGVLVNLTAYTVSPLITTMLDDATEVIARTTLGAVGTTGNETVAGVKAFTGANTHTGAETHTGIETFPTAAVGTSTTQIATTAFTPAALPTNWIRAELKGSGLFLFNTGSPSVAALNGTDVAFVTTGDSTIRTYRFNGTNWVQVGTHLFLPVVGGSALAALNGTDVAFIDSTQDTLRTYRFDGTNWAQVGNALTVANVLGPALAALNGTDVAFVDATNDSLRTYRFDGTNWAQVGNSFAIATVGLVALAALNGTDVAFVDETNDSLRTYRFDGTNWAQVGNSLAIATVLRPALAALNGTDVAFIDDSNDSLRTYRFDGTNWALVGSGLAIATVTFPALAALNGTDVAFIDDSNKLLSTYRFAFDIGN